MANGATPSPLPDASTTSRGAVNTSAQTFTGRKTLTDGVTIDTALAVVPHSQTLAGASTAVALTGARMHVSSATRLELTSTPSVTAGTVVGQQTQIVNSGTAVVSLRSEASLTGSKLKLRSRKVFLAPRSSVTVTWDGSFWVEDSRATFGAPNELHVADFGAVGDGVTDDAPAIQAAVNEAVVSGGVVRLMPGATHLIASEILVTGGNVQITGGGKYTGSVTTASNIRSMFAVDDGVLHLSHVQMFCGRTASYGVYINSASTSVFESCRVYQPLIDGFHIEAVADSCRFVNCLAEFCGKAYATANYAGSLTGSLRTLRTGTVSVAGDVLTGVGTAFTTMGIRVGDFISIHPTGAGDFNSTWRAIFAVVSDTQLTLVGTAVTIAAGADYSVHVGNGYHEGPGRADNNNHIIDGWTSRNIAGCGIHVHGLYGPNVYNAQCDASGAYPVSVATSGVVTIGACFRKMYFEINNAADNFCLGYVADLLIDQVNGTGQPVLLNGGGQVWGVIRGMQNASDPGRIDPLGDPPVDYIPSARLVAGAWAKGAIYGMNYSQNGTGLSSLTMKDALSASWAAVSGVESPQGGYDTNACAFYFNTNTALARPGGLNYYDTKRLARWSVAGVERFSLGTEGELFSKVATGQNFLNALDGARLNFSTADASAYLYRSAVNTIRTPGNFTVDGTLTATMVGLSGTNTGDVTLAAVGAAPSVNGATLSGQVLTLQPADATRPGILANAAQHFPPGTKTLHGELVLGYPGDTGDGRMTSPNGVTALNLYGSGLLLTTAAGGYLEGLNASGFWTFKAINKLTVDSAMRVMPGGASNNYVDVGGRLDSQTTPVGNVGAGEDTLMATTILANAMNVNARGYRYKGAGAIANNANAKTLKIYFGSQIISVTLPVLTAGNWFAEFTVLRTGSSAQRYVVEVRVVDSATDAVSGVFMAQGTLTETETSTITVKATGTATADNDIVQNFLLLETV